MSLPPTSTCAPSRAGRAAAVLGGSLLRSVAGLARRGLRSNFAVDPGRAAAVLGGSLLGSVAGLARRGLRSNFAADPGRAAAVLGGSLLGSVAGLARGACGAHCCFCVIGSESR